MVFRQTTRRWVTRCLAVLWFVTIPADGLWAAPKPTTAIKHKPPEFFKTGYRLLLNANVNDPQRVQLVRCYFRYGNQAEFLFVPMTLSGQNVYQATLAAPAEGVGKIEYLFLVVNQAQQVVKTEPHLLALSQTKKTPDWLLPPTTQAPVVMYTELAAPPEDTSQFGDSVSVDVAESTARFGVVAGLYAGLSSGSTSAVPVGTIATTTGGSSATGVVLAVVAVGAAAGGVAYAVTSLEEDEEEADTLSPDNTTPTPTPTPSPNTECADLAGSWSGSYSGYDCMSYPDDGSFTMNINADCTGSGFIGYTDQTFTIVKTGNNTLTINGLTDEECGDISASGSYSTNAMSGSHSFASGNGGTWMAER